jgi:pyrophosphatase PpaX
MMKEYHYVLLDWDGNLAKTLDVWLEACRIPLKKRGLDLSDEEIATCFGVPIERFSEWGIKDVDEAISEMDALAKKFLPEVELYPDAMFVLETVKNSGKKMALITTSFREVVIPILDKYNMLHYFDVIVANEDTKKHKPDPEPIEKAIKLLGGDKDRAIMVGDSDKDIGAAVNAGIDSALFYPPEHRKYYNLDELKKHLPTYILTDFRKLIEVVSI